jgi:protein associated with RNAse G/E
MRLILSLKGSWLKIQSYKHDGSLHRCWERNYVLLETEQFFVTANHKTKVTETNGRRWFSKEPAVSFFSKDDWFNVIGMIKDRGVVFYVNIASPTLLHHGILKYIDYDLDYKLFPDGYIMTLDEREFEKHSVRYQYPEDLKKVLVQSAERVFKKLQGRDYPFQMHHIQELYQQFIKEKKFLF